MDRIIDSSPVNSTTRSSLLVDLDCGFSQSGIQQRRRARYRRSLSWVVAIRTATALRRLTDLTLAASLTLLLSPALILLCIAASLSGGGIRKRKRLGRWATQFNQYQLCFSESAVPSRQTFLHSLPALFNVVKGDMALIGPRAVSPREEIMEERAAWKRYDLRPGLLSLWWLRRRANIAYSSEVDVDLEYVETNTLMGDLGIAVRAVPAAFFGGGVSNAPPELNFLGVRIDNLTMAEASAQIVALANAPLPAQICFVNADCVNIAFADMTYRAALSGAKLVLADGIGVRVAGTILNQNIRENINGTDMLPYLCAAAEDAGLSLYLLGGRPGVPEDAAAWMAEHYPRLKVAGCHHGYFSPEEQPQVIEEIAASGAAILLVAMGAPRQERWIAAHKDQLGTKVNIGVGGLLDFYAGRVPRAPIWVRELGMEWFFRFWQEPRRMWRRYFLGNAVFLYRVLRERVRTHLPRRAGIA